MRKELVKNGLDKKYKQCCRKTHKGLFNFNVFTKTWQLLIDIKIYKITG